MLAVLAAAALLLLLVLVLLTWCGLPTPFLHTRSSLWCSQRTLYRFVPMRRRKGISPCFLYRESTLVMDAFEFALYPSTGVQVMGAVSRGVCAVRPSFHPRWRHGIDAHESIITCTRKKTLRVSVSGSFCSLFCSRKG